MKFFFLFALILSGWLSAAAASVGWQSLVVDMRNADPVVIDLSSTLSLRVEEDVLVISDFDDSSEIYLYDIISVTHRKSPHNVATGEDIAVAVDEIHDSEFMSPKITMCPEGVIFSGFPDGCKGSVISLSGDVVLSFVVEEDFVMPLSLLEKGIYIVNAGGVSLKIGK